MLALRSDERAAAGVGVDVAKVKIAAFAFAGALAGLGGALKAYELGTFSSDTFSVLASLTLLAYAYLGGISTVGGSFWAGALATGGLAAVLTDRAVELGQYEAYVAGVVLVATAVSSNEGIDGANRALMQMAPGLACRPCGNARFARSKNGEGGEGMSEPVLETRKLTVRFGGVTALDSVSLACRPGEIAGLIGPNGAGKTTFLDAVCGFLPKNVTGEVLLEGRDVTGLSPHRLARRGLGRTWQSVDLFDDLDIRGNLEVAAGGLTFFGALGEMLSRRRPIPAVEETLQMLGMETTATQLPSSLTQRDRKLVGIGRAAAGDQRYSCSMSLPLDSIAPRPKT